jgi:hypothetical protein
MSVTVASSAAKQAEEESSWSDIAVALTQTSGDDVALELAGGVARQHGARLEVLQLVVMPAPMIDAWAMVPDSGFGLVYADLCEAADRSAPCSSITPDAAVRS